MSISGIRDWGFRLVGLASAGLGAAALLGVLSTAPATDTGARVPGPTGDWRAVPGGVLYDAADYYRVHGFKYVDGLLEQARAASGERIEIREADLVAAQSLLEGSVARSPGDALAWAGLALLAAIRGDSARYETALLRSGRLAPFSNAISRVRLTGLGVDPDAPLPAEAIEILRRDLRVVAREIGPEAVRRILKVAPYLAPAPAAPPGDPTPLDGVPGRPVLQ